MAVMARESWTDPRLDDLNHRVDVGFKEMREEFRAMRSEFAASQEAVRGEIAANQEAMRGEMAANQRTLVQIAAGIWITALVGFLGVITTIVTQV
jgi:hypothetical protein